MPRIRIGESDADFGHLNVLERGFVGSVLQRIEYIEGTVLSKPTKSGALNRYAIDEMRALRWLLSNVKYPHAPSVRAYRGSPENEDAARSAAAAKLCRVNPKPKLG